MSVYLLIPLVAILIYLALIFESTGIALLGFSAAFLGLLSFVSLIYIRGRVSVDLRIPIRLVKKDQSFGIRIEMKNESVLPVGRICLLIRYGEARGGIREKKRLSLHHVRRGKKAVTHRLSVGCSGCYEFETYRIRIYDPFGIFYWNLKKSCSAKAMVLPEIEEVPVMLGESIRHFYGEAVSYDERTPGGDPSEIFGVREFRDGDKLQRVHWKLSARTDELMVKEDSQPRSCPVILFMPEGAMGENGSLDYMASLSFTLMDQHCGHYIVYNSQDSEDLVRVRVMDEESYYFALTLFLQDGMAKSEGDRLERYREKYKSEPYLHSILADADGGISLDGGAAVHVEEFRRELLLR